MIIELDKISDERWDTIKRHNGIRLIILGYLARQADSYEARAKDRPTDANTEAAGVAAEIFTGAVAAIKGGELR